MSDELRARRTDPETSHIAAKRARGFDTALLAAIAASGAYGATLDDVVAATGIQKVSVSPQFVRLERKGLIRRTGGTRPGIAGLPQQVWVVETLPRQLAPAKPKPERKRQAPKPGTQMRLF